MIFEFIRLALLKTARSVALGRNILASTVTILFVLFMMANVVVLALVLDPLLSNFVGEENIIPFLNNLIIFFVLGEILYRYFFQKRPLFDIQAWLHLPVKTSKIVHYLLLRSLISPFSFVVILLFTPITISTISAEYGVAGGVYWLGTLFFISIGLHWGVLWYKQRFGHLFIATLAMLIPIFSSFILVYFNMLNIGEYTSPFFEYALMSPVPLLISFVASILLYGLVFSFYVKNAYIEDKQKESNLQFSGKIPGVFSRFGLPGEIADMELKLILRHKKSRSYLIIAVVFLLYGLLFYGDDTLSHYFVLFVGTFITGAFFLQYGQLLLSWNSANFDFFMNRPFGLESLIRGKWLLFILMSCLFYILSIPYGYFGWDILAIHTAGFLYNIGIGVHLIMYIALWEPKPMDISKGAMFNYDGVGMAQFLMVLPYLIIPYAIYVPISIFTNQLTAMFALGLTGLIGFLFSEQLLKYSINKLQKTRYTVSSTFRQEL